jgi:hypothetical protein
MASILGGLLGMGPGIYILLTLVRRGHGSALGILAGTAVAGLTFVGASVVLGWIARGLVSKS